MVFNQIRHKLFRFPDQKLLETGPDLSYREFEIIRLIEAGLSSKEIADKLFMSLHTVNTHRSNILEKTGKSQISDVIYEFKEKGLLLEILTINDINIHNQYASIQYNKESLEILHHRSHS